MNGTLQDSFLNHMRRENASIKIVMLDGNALEGTVRGFDNFTISLISGAMHHLVYKHAIAQIISSLPPAREPEERPAGRPQAREGEERRAPREPREPREPRPPRPPRPERAPHPEGSPEGAGASGSAERPPRPEASGPSHDKRGSGGFNPIDLSKIQPKG